MRVEITREMRCVRTFEQSDLEVRRPYRFCLTLEGFPALAAGDHGVTVRVAFIAWGEDVEGGFEVSHVDGRGRGGMIEYEEREGEGVIYLAVGGESCRTYETEPQGFYVGDGRVEAED